MKNKKLFAILTLVCFMFTLMPVAAFAAAPYVDVDDDYALVETGDEVVVTVGPTTATGMYVFALDSTGALYKDMTLTKVNGAGQNVLAPIMPTTTKVAGIDQWNVRNADLNKEGMVNFTVTFADADEYTIYVVPSTLAQGDAAYAIVNNDELTRAQKVGLLKDEAFDSLDVNVTVNDVRTEYHFCESATHGTAVTADTVTIDKANSVEEATIELFLHNVQGQAVVGKKVTISTNSSALDVSAKEVTTDAAGRVKFDVTASIAGEYKVYVEYGNKADVTITVNAGNTGAADIETKYNGSLVDLDTDLAATDMMFTITDINGNIIDGTTYDANLKGYVNRDDLGYNNPGVNSGLRAYYVRVVEAPAGSAVTNKVLENAELCYDANEAAWYLTGVELDKEGNYEFKVVLENGASTTATVSVKEFQVPVSISLAYQAPAVELNGYNVMKALKFVDANGVKTTKGTDEIKLAATGYAVDAFAAEANSLVKTTVYQVKVNSVWENVSKLTYDQTAATYDTTDPLNITVNNKRTMDGYAGQGTVKAKADERYIGSTITVTAVSEKYNLVATTSMVVANEAAEIKYASTDADVAVNNTLVANVVDVDGNKVALTDIVGRANISYVVLEKPEGAKVAVSTASEQLATKGQFKVSFTANEIGSYKVQTIVTYEQADGVVKYYSGIETITVGNTGFEDIVVMSIGSNEIVVNNATKVIPSAPIVENNRTFVPFRALIEAFGAEVAWDEATQAVTAELNDTVVVMTIGSATYTVNGVEKSMDVAPFIKDASTMIPVRFVAEEFGITVTPTYDENGATADILFAK